MPRTKQDNQEDFPMVEDLPAISPSAMQTEKERQQEDVIRALQQQIAALAGDVAKLSKKTNIKVGATTRDGSGKGFIRSWNGVPVVAWKMAPGSYAAINQFGQEVDEQYMEFELLNGEKVKEHYTKFDQITKINQIPCLIPNYCEKNNLGEWRARKHDLYDKVEVTLSEDNGLTFEGAKLQIPYYALN